MEPVTVERADVIAFRAERHQLGREPASVPATDVDLLDLGVQDTGTFGSAWALDVRGARPAGPDDLLLAWTIRGAPHAYRRHDVSAVTVATAPFSEADAASRVFDASKQLREAGIDVLDALRIVARLMREIVRRPRPKGDVSSRLSERLDPPYLRRCRSCDATHSYEQTFRLAALQAGLELEPGTSPPVLRRIPGRRAAPYRHLGTEADPRFDLIRGYLRFYGPSPVKALAAYLDAPVAEVKANLPSDVVDIRVRDLDGKADGKKATRLALEDDVEVLVDAAGRSGNAVVRLVGSHDPYLQLRDRDLLVAERPKQKDLWRTLGRPGAVLVDGEVVGTWRPRTSGGALSVEVDPWSPVKGPTRAAVLAEAERLAAHRDLRLKAVDGV
jgi:hypothetical protein